MWKCVQHTVMRSQPGASGIGSFQRTSQVKPLAKPHAKCAGKCIASAHGVARIDFKRGQRQR